MKSVVKSLNDHMAKNVSDMDSAYELFISGRVTVSGYIELCNFANAILLTGIRDILGSKGNKSITD